VTICPTQLQEHIDLVTICPCSCVGHIDLVTMCPCSCAGHIDLVTMCPCSCAGHIDLVTMCPCSCVGHIDLVTMCPCSCVGSNCVPNQLFTNENATSWNAPRKSNIKCLNCDSPSVFVQHSTLLLQNFHYLCAVNSMRFNIKTSDYNIV
jgi:hypothetical protein